MTAIGSGVTLRIVLVAAVLTALSSAIDMMRRIVPSVAPSHAFRNTQTTHNHRCVGQSRRIVNRAEHPAHGHDLDAIHSAITLASLALASASSRVSASLRPASGLKPLTMLSDERGSGTYVMTDVQTGSHAGCVMGKGSRTPGGRLMDLRTAAAYLGCSYWTLRDLALNGHVPVVRIPSPRAKDGRAMRRILIDSRDLDLLIERWKEVNNADIATTGDRHP